MMKEEQVLDKALDVLDDALDGKGIHPNALSTAVAMTQFFWGSVYGERLKKEQMKEALREVWDEQIKEK